MKLTDISKVLKNAPQMKFNERTLTKDYPWLAIGTKLDSEDIDMNDKVELFERQVLKHYNYLSLAGYYNIDLARAALKDMLIDDMDSSITRNVRNMIPLESVINDYIKNNRILLITFTVEGEKQYYVVIIDKDNVMLSKGDMKLINESYKLLLDNNPSTQQQLYENVQSLKDKFHVQDIQNITVELSKKSLFYPEFKDSIEMFNKLIYLLSL